MLANKKSIIDFLTIHNIATSPSDIYFEALKLVSQGDITIHPYGFYIIKPYDDTISKVRFHIWLNNLRIRQQPDWPQHNHNHDINSMVIKGSLLHNKWNVDSIGSLTNTLFEVGYSQKQSFLIKSNQAVSCRLNNSKIVNADSTYFLQAFSYHSVDVDNSENTITMCVTSNHSKNIQHVVGSNNASEKYSFLRKNVSDEARLGSLSQLNEIRESFLR